MPGNGRYPAELRERAVRMVLENERLYGSQWEAICSVAAAHGSPDAAAGRSSASIDPMLAPISGACTKPRMNQSSPPVPADATPATVQASKPKPAASASSSASSMRFSRSLPSGTRAQLLTSPCGLVSVVWQM